MNESQLRLALLPILLFLFTMLAFLVAQLYQLEDLNQRLENLEQYLKTKDSLYQETYQDPITMGIRLKGSNAYINKQDVLYHSICMVESQLQPNAYNQSSGAAGVCQQKKIYVDEVNRILGYDKYSYEDRYNPRKAREMFEITQAKYNPDKDFEVAMGSHYLGAYGYSRNPNKANVYIRKVKLELNKQLSI